MNNGTALILFGIDEANKASRFSTHCAVPAAPQILQIKALTSQYTGYAFLVRAAAEADARAVAAGDLPRNHWFWSVVKVALAQLRAHRACRLSDQHARARDAIVHHERLRPGHSEWRHPLTDCAIDRDGPRHRVRFCASHGTKPHDRRNRKNRGRGSCSQHFRTRDGGKNGAAAGSVGIIANQLRDFNSVREFFTSGSVVSATDLIFAVLFIGVLFIIAGPLAWIPLCMLPIMLAGWLYPAASARSRDEATAG